MSPRRPWSERARRLGGWLLPAASLALAPKCALCLLAYAGLGTVLGLGGPEFCGATPAASGPLIWLLPLVGVSLGMVKLRRRRT